MWLTGAILGFVTLERLAELVLAGRNTRVLRARGAVEFAAGHYPLIVGLHAAWLGGLWFLAWGRPVSWPLLAAFAVLQVLRVWVLLTLRARWTTRILHLPGEALVARGPYRFLRHPNYVVVVGEIAALPLVFGLIAYAALFSALNAAVLLVRVRAEDAALRNARMEVR
jgi:methyltransferase